MIAIVDYGAGNLFSVQNALDFLCIDYCVTKEAKTLQKAQGIILPGVGAFPDAMKRLQDSGLVETLQKESQRKPFLGICLGMQMLFDYGYEFEKTPGLGLIPGTVEGFVPQGLKIPHMGWNQLTITKPCALTQGINDGDYVYYVHSYLAKTPMAYISATSQYGETIPGLVHHDYIFGAQFHPEKSGEAGLTLLKNFGRLVQC